MTESTYKNRPLVSIIVICWNNKKFLKRCFDSLIKLEYRPVELILPDNGSTDGSVEFIQENYPNVTVIENKKNLGFAEGNNVAIRKAHGKYIFTLNPDTQIDSACIDRLVEAAEVDKKIGSCTPKMYIMDRGNLLNSAGGDMLLKSGDNISRGFYLEDEGQFEKNEEVFGPSAGAGFYRRDMIEEVGCFDKGLFTYYEDADLNIRMQIFGWKCMFVPKAIVYHYVSGTLNIFNWKKEFYLNRNKYYTILKNFSIKLIVFCSGEILRSYVGMLKRLANQGKFLLLLGIHLSLLIKIPQILMKRRVLFKKIKTYPNYTMKDWLLRHHMMLEKLKIPEAMERYYSDLKHRNAI